MIDDLPAAGRAFRAHDAVTADALGVLDRRINHHEHTAMLLEIRDEMKGWGGCSRANRARGDHHGEREHDSVILQKRRP